MSKQACTNRYGMPKRRWATKKAAVFVAEWQTVVRKNATYAYHCEACGKWHVATQRLVDRSVQ